MSAHDETEKVLRQLHVLLSKSEPYAKDPSKVVVDKQQVLDLLADLNKCVYNIYDEYELTQRSRDRAEREFRKQGDQIIWDASRKAEDIYAASVMYTDEALNRVWQIISDTSDKMTEMCADMENKLKDEVKTVKTNQLELKSQLQDLRDTEKYLGLIEERNRELAKQKEAGKKSPIRQEQNLYANRQTEIKVNTEYLERMGMATEPAIDGVVEKPEPTKEEPVQQVEVKDKKDMTPEELEMEEKLRADLDNDYFDWQEKSEDGDKTDKAEKSDLSEGIQKMWKSLKNGKNK